MKDFNEAKKAYESVSVPEELNDRVQAGIRQGKRNRSRHVWSRSLGTAAACFAVLVGVLNLSPTVASAAADVPVLGGLFQVLTVRDYETEEGGIDYAVSVPGVESGSELAQQVNEEIQKRVDAHLAQAQADWAEYQDAFFATGGTEEEWGGRQMDVVIDYEIKSQSETTVSFVVDFAEGWVSAQQQRFCYNLDLEQTKNLMLTDCAKEPRLEKAYRLLNLSEREFNAIRSGSLENLGADRTRLILDKALSWAARNYAGWDLYQYLREELGMSNEEISHAGFELDEFYEDETDYEAEDDYEEDCDEEL